MLMNTVVKASLVLALTFFTACGSGGKDDGGAGPFGGSSGGGAGSFGGAYGGAGGSSGSSCATPTALFDNWNSLACSSLTDKSSFTLSAAVFVTSLDLWIDTSVAGATLQYSLMGPGGIAVSSGILSKGSCDPIQSAWCQLSARLGQTLAAGSYSVTLSAQAICSNAGTSNLGFVKVQGCPAGGRPDAGIPVTPDASAIRDTASTGGFVGACATDYQCIEYTSAPTSEVARLQSQCSSLYMGTWRTSPRCNVNWCGTCALTAPGQISYVAYYTLCSAELSTQCQALGGVFTMK